MANLKLAPTSFASGAKDSVATVDVYSKNTNTPINSIQALSTKFDVTTLNSMLGGDYLDGGAPVIRAVTDSGLTVSPQALAARLVGGSKSLLGGVKDLSAQAQSNVNGTFDDTGSVYAKVGGVMSAVSSASFADVTALGNLISTIVGGTYDFSVDDYDGAAALYVGIINEAIGLGIPNSVGALLATITNPVILNRVVIGVLPIIISKSDTVSLLALATGAPAGVIKSANPGALGQFLQGYASPKTAGVSSLKDENTQLFTTFDAVDPSWDSYTRTYTTSGGVRTTQPITSLKSLNGASSDAQKVIVAGATQPQGADSKDRSLYGLATVFAKRASNNCVLTDFPLAAYTTQATAMLNAS